MRCSTHARPSSSAMASSRNSIPADPVGAVMMAAQAGLQSALQSAVPAALLPPLESGSDHAVPKAPPPAVRVAVALSGGNDSMALLDAVASAAAGQVNVEVSAVHVHHGLSPYADAWVAFCERECADRNITIDVRRV